MNVKAAKGLLVPREENPREYITDEKAEPVDVTPYYLRRLANGELVEQFEETAPVAKKQAAKAS